LRFMCGPAPATDAFQDERECPVARQGDPGANIVALP